MTERLRDIQELLEGGTGDMTDFDWSVVEKVGIAGIALAVIYFGFKLFVLFMEQWKNSTDAVNKNTEAFGELSRVFALSHEREIDFQTHVKKKLEDSEKREKDTLDKVIEIHERMR